MKDLISQILVPAEKRITIDKILSHPWMNKPLGEQKLILDFKKMRNFSSFSKVVFLLFSLKL